MKIQEITAKELRTGDIIVFGASVNTSESLIEVGRVRTADVVTSIETPGGIGFHWGNGVTLNILRPTESKIVIDAVTELDGWIEWYDQVLNVAMKTTVDDYSAPYKTSSDLLKRISQSKGE